MIGKWSSRDIPCLDGRVAIVTGANSGVGYEIAVQLAARGAHVVLAARNKDRLRDAVDRLQTAAPGASVEAMHLDLAELASVTSFARAFADRYGGLDILINNAGISGGPRRETVDGFEMLFQVNYLGHFALTGLLLPLLNVRPGARVVTISSDIATAGRIDFDDLQAKRRYGLVRTYAQAKLAGLVFAIELERRARAVGANFSSLATNPGIAKTDLFSAKLGEWGRPLTFPERLLQIVQAALGRPASIGALPGLYQATDLSARASEYVVGAKWPRPPHPIIEAFPPRARDPALAARLWDTSIKLTGVRYEALSARAPRSDL